MWRRYKYRVLISMSAQFFAQFVRLVFYSFLSCRPRRAHRSMRRLTDDSNPLVGNRTERHQHRLVRFPFTLAAVSDAICGWLTWA